jgi:2-polyprenyl-3-methyl-5-hydroxy-6-metoxy-1,4-benzoquinol methylase
MTHSQCRLCASDNLRLLQKEENKGATYTIVQCRGCDVIQTLEHYDTVSPDYVNLDMDEITIDRIWCQGRHKLPAYQQWWKSANNLMGSIDPDAKILDIGCGTGGFLRFAREKGLTPFGFDASRAQAEYAQQDLPNVRQATSPAQYLEQIGPLDQKFDFVVCWDVLEHLRNPLPFLMEIQTLLRPGGFLFVSIPNGRAMLWKRHIYNITRRHFSFHPWEHVFYYSPRSLSAYLNQSGYHVVHVSSVACYPRPFSIFEMFRRAGFMALKYFPALSPQISAWAKFENSPLVCSKH